MADSPSSDSRPRKAVGRALRDSEAPFRTIIESGPDEFFAHDILGKILDVNQTACDNLGYSREELLAMEVRDVEVGVSVEDSRALWGRVALGAAETVQGVQRRKDGTTFPVEVRVGALEFQGEKLLFAAARDITDRQEAEKALRVSEERFRQLVENTADAIMLHISNGTVIDANQNARDMLGYTQEELINLSPREINPNWDEDGPVEWKDFPLEIPVMDEGVVLRKDGTLIPVEVHLTPFESEGQWLMLSVNRDITGRQQAEAAQRELAVLEERNRLARDLHDSVTQSLYSLTLFAEAGLRLAHSSEWDRVTSYLGELGETSQQALKEMRLLVHQLLPLDLEKSGLVGALQQRLDAVEGRARVEAQLLVDSDLELSPQIQECFYRICLEALNNSLKHAIADQVTVRISGAQGEVQLEIRDNGTGFDPDSLRDRGGLGLTSIRQRVDELGGFLDIISKPGEGTKVIVSVANLS